MPADERKVRTELPAFLGRLHRRPGAAVFVGQECAARGRSPLALSSTDMVEMADLLGELGRRLRERSAVVRDGCDAGQVGRAAVGDGTDKLAPLDDLDEELGKVFGALGARAGVAGFVGIECFARGRAPTALTSADLAEMSDVGEALAELLRGRARSTSN